MPGGGTRLRSPETPASDAKAPRVRVPVRASSVVTGLDRSCRAELIGFASPIGRLSAILRITDDATGNTATSVVPVELPRPLEGATRTAEMRIPQSEVRARELRAETEPVRLMPSLRGGTLLEELMTANVEGATAHRLALVLTTALRAGALTSALCSSGSRTPPAPATTCGLHNDLAEDAGFDVGPESTRNRPKEVSA